MDGVASKLSVHRSVCAIVDHLERIGAQNVGDYDRVEIKDDRVVLVYYPKDTAAVRKFERMVTATAMEAVEIDRLTGEIRWLRS